MFRVLRLPRLAVAQNVHSETTVRRVASSTCQLGAVLLQVRQRVPHGARERLAACRCANVQLDVRDCGVALDTHFVRAVVEAPPYPAVQLTAVSHAAVYVRLAIAVAVV